MSRQITQIVFFSILALLSYALWKYYFDTAEIIQDKPFTKGYSVENIELRITDEAGKLTAKFKSPSLTRYTDSPIVFIDEPLFWMYKNGTEHWLIQSNKAEFNTTTDEVNIYGDLIAKTIHSQAPMSFSANNLVVNLNSKLAHTKDGISLNQQQFTMTGQIAQFDLNNETLEVNNNVKAIYKTINKNNK